MKLAETKRFSLTTPESVVLSFPLAEVPTRVVAFGIDLFLIMFATLVVLVIAAFAMAASSLSEPLAIGLIGVFLVRQFYFTLFEVIWHGATPGKRALGIRVVSRDGSGLTVDAVITRNLMRDVEIFLPLTLAIVPEQVFGNVPWWSWMPAVLWVVVLAALPLMTRERTRAGDLVGGTVVVRVPKAELLRDEAARVSLAPAASAFAHGAPEGGLRFTVGQLGHYGERELETLADLIRKIDEGKATTEDQAHIARTIAAKIGYEGREPTFDPTRFLQTFYKQQRGALEKQLLFGKRKASKHED